MGLTDLPTPQIGKSLEQSGTTAQWQRVMDSCELIENLVVQHPLRATRTTKTLTLAIDLPDAKPSAIAAAAGAAVDVLTLVEDVWDYLICTDDEGESIIVAKPFLLQPTRTVLRQDVSYVYSGADRREGTKTIGLTNVRQTEIPTPQYVIGDLIVAVGIPEEFAEVSPPPEGEPIDATHIDLNVDGRVWAARNVILI